MDSHKDDSPHIPKARGCELMGRSYWVRVWTYVFLLAGHAFTLNQHGKQRSLLQASRALLLWCQTKCKPICQPKCAQLNILHV